MICLRPDAHGCLVSRTKELCENQVTDFESLGHRICADDFEGVQHGIDGRSLPPLSNWRDIHPARSSRLISNPIDHPAHRVFQVRSVATASRYESLAILIRLHLSRPYVRMMKVKITCFYENRMNSPIALLIESEATKKRLREIFQPAACLPRMRSVPLPRPDETKPSSERLSWSAPLRCSVLRFIKAGC
jgi:hypothetical protein